VKNVPGRKTDVQDCQWLQYLHSVGLLRGSFRPPEPSCAVRALRRHRDRRIQASRETIAKALVGDYRPEHLFTLRQSLEAYRHYQRLIGDCDGQVQALLGALESAIDPAVHPLPPPPGRIASPRAMRRGSTCGPNSTGSSALT
jgi:hypothetical protein